MRHLKLFEEVVKVEIFFYISEVDDDITGVFRNSNGGKVGFIEHDRTCIPHILSFKPDNTWEEFTPEELDELSDKMKMIRETEKYNL